VFLVRGAPDTYEARLWAAVLATGGVLGFATAAHLWGMTDQMPADVHVIIPRDLHLPPHPGIRTHRHLARPNTRARRNGLPVTSRVETVLDHVGRLPVGEAGTIADRAIQRGWLRPADIDRRLRQQPGRTGNARLRELAELTSDGAAAVSERVLHRLLRQGGITGWRANHDVWCDGYLVAVVDVAFPHRRLAVEVDGWAFHHTPDRFQRDRVRQNALTGLGWTVLRFTWADLMERPGYVLATIRAHLG
jgi:very-short-patch-repair endonuclease